MEDLTEHEEATDLVVQYLLEERFKSTQSDVLTDTEEEELITVLSNILVIAKNAGVSDITFPSTDGSEMDYKTEDKKIIFDHISTKYAELITLLKAYFISEDLAPLQKYYEAYTDE